MNKTKLLASRSFSIYLLISLNLNWDCLCVACGHIFVCPTDAPEPPTALYAYKGGAQRATARHTTWHTVRENDYHLNNLNNVLASWIRTPKNPDRKLTSAVIMIVIFLSFLIVYFAYIVLFSWLLHSWFQLHLFSWSSLSLNFSYTSWATYWRPESGLQWIQIEN